MTADRQDDEEGPETELVIVLSKDTDGIWSCEVEFSNYVSTGGGGFDTAEEALAFGKKAAERRRG